MTLELDRIEIESAGPDPAAMAQVLLGQLSGLDGRVPIGEIALALDILAIEVAPLRGLTACLQCDRQKSYGQIVVAARSSSRRRRYSIAHELGHFLNDGHEPTGSAGFDCTGLDMAEPARAGRHLRQEREANAFAIEVLTPRHLLTPHLEGRADLARALEISARFDVSRQAAARRYVRLHPACLAVVFSKDGRIVYLDRPADFPLTRPWWGDRMGPLPRATGTGNPLTGFEEVDAGAWLRCPADCTLLAQTLYQQKGHATALLLAA